MEMFDEVKQRTPDGKKVEERNDFQVACDDFRHATKKFATIDFRVHTDNNADASQWFFWLGQRYLTEERARLETFLRRLRERKNYPLVLGI